MSRNGLPEVVCKLLSLGANPQDTIDMGSTALHVAAFRGQEECVRALLDNIPPAPRRALVHKRNNLGNALTAADEARNETIRAMIREYMQ